MGKHDGHYHQHWQHSISNTPTPTLSPGTGAQVLLSSRQRHCTVKCTITANNVNVLVCALLCKTSEPVPAAFAKMCPNERKADSVSLPFLSLGH